MLLEEFCLVTFSLGALGYFVFERQQDPGRVRWGGGDIGSKANSTLTAASPMRGSNPRTTGW